MSCGCGQSGPLCIVRGQVLPMIEGQRMVTAKALVPYKATLLDGIRVRWLGLVWRGVPEPLRWMIEKDRMLPMELPGCGCLDRWKTLVERFVAWCNG